LSPVTRVTVATYQSVTGTGAAARAELLEQSRAVLDGRDMTPSVYPHQIAFNLLDTKPDITDRPNARHASV
jgi:aspartate-semialdehyde dehydrogenase